MEVPIQVEFDKYCDATVILWTGVWETICRMAYEEDYPKIESIITSPSYMIINGLVSLKKSEVQHVEYYKKRIPANEYDITLDHMWKKYSKKYGTKMPNVVPEFIQLHVPQQLFEDLGVLSWFKYSFPNCQITYWS